MKKFSFLNKNCPQLVNQQGWIIFQIGLFLLSSTALFGGILLVIAAIYGSFQKGHKYFKDPWNYPFFIASVLMIVGSIRAYSGWLAWVGLANWLPFFWVFWGFQPYLQTSASRRQSALCLLTGSVPILVTGIGQIFFGWEGPWQLFNGLIVWFVSPGGEPNGRLSGLFDYANIAGAWLSLIWPIALATLLQKNVSFFKRTIIFIFVIAIVSSLVLTDSRNAWGALILAVPFVFGSNSWLWLLPLVTCLLIPVFIAVVPWFGIELQQFFRAIVPETIWSRLSDVRYMQERSLASTRLNQWSVAINLLQERPWLGWGAAAFSIIYPLRTGLWHGHAHNLPLELSVSNGIPVAVLIVFTIIFLLFVTFGRVVLFSSIKDIHSLNFTIFDRAWWTSSFILLVMHASDMPFFDSRLNIAGWVMLAGLRSLLRQK